MTVSECEVNSVTIYFWETDAATLEPDDISGPLVTNTCMGGGSLNTHCVPFLESLVLEQLCSQSHDSPSSETTLHGQTTEIML